MRCLLRLAQLLDAGVAAKRAPGKHPRREFTCFGHDRREIDLLAGQHHLVDQRSAFFRQALARLIAYQCQHASNSFGEQSPIGQSQRTQQVEGLRGEIAPALAQLACRCETDEKIRRTI